MFIGDNVFAAAVTDLGITITEKEKVMPNYCRAMPTACSMIQGIRLKSSASIQKNFTHGYWKG